MSFRRRNVGLSKSPTSVGEEQPANDPAISLAGVRPSPIDGRQTTSTGSQTLDDLLAGHAGLPMDSVLLIEETGATDFAGALLRYFAAEGVIQGHQVHVVGASEQWARDLPGLSENAGAHLMSKYATDNSESQRMKIAWRYERLGNFGSNLRGELLPLSLVLSTRSKKALNRPGRGHHKNADSFQLLQHPPERP